MEEMMVMRLGFAAAALSALLMGADAGPAMAQSVQGPKVKWQLSTYGRPRSTTAGTEMLAEIVKERTGGNFEIQNVYDSLSPLKENLDGVKIGAFESGFIIASLHPGKTPTLNVFNLPFLPLGDMNVQARVMAGYYRLPAVVQDVGRWDSTVILPHALPAYELVGRGRKPTTVAELKGLRVRAPGELGDALKKVGAVPTSMQATEVYQGLERGLVDAAAFPFFAMKIYRTQDVCEWYTTNVAFGITSGFTVAGLKPYNALPAQYKALLETAAKEAVTRHIEIFRKEEEDGMAALKAKNLQAISFSANEIAQFVEHAGKPIWDDWIKEMDSKGFPGRDLLDYVLNESKKGAS